jgi:hypothetical protein
VSSYQLISFVEQPARECRQQRDIEIKREIVLQISNQLHFFTTVPSTIVTWKKSGISLGPRDISQDHRNKTRFMLLYYSYSRPLREARGNHCHTFFIEHQAHPRSCRRHPPPPLSSLTAAAVVNGSYCSWQCCRGLPHGGGKACQYFWRPGSSSIEAFVWGDARLTRDDAVPSPIIGDAIATTERRRQNLRHLRPSDQRRQPPSPLRGGRRHVRNQSAAAGGARVRACLA